MIGSASKPRLCPSKYLSLFVRKYPQKCRQPCTRLRRQACPDLSLNPCLNLDLNLNPSLFRALFEKLFQQLFRKFFAKLFGSMFESRFA